MLCCLLLPYWVGDSVKSLVPLAVYSRLPKQAVCSLFMYALEDALLYQCWYWPGADDWHSKEPAHCQLLP